MAGNLGKRRSGAIPKPPAPTPHEKAEHEGRVPQVGIPSGPRQTVPALPGSPAAGKPVYVPATNTYVPGKVARSRARATERKKRVALAPVKTRAKKRSQRVKVPKSKTVAYKPPPSPRSKPPKFKGKPTAGTPTLKELQTGSKSETLKVNKKGFVTTAPVRAASRKLKKAKAVVRKSQPSTKGLQPAERSVVPLARKAHRKYPDVPVSVLMAQMKQESGFNPAAVSPAEAQGLSQFIPSTAASYNVRYGTGRKEQQSQVTGQAHYLHDLGFAKDPKAAMSGYTGGYSDAEYNDPVLTDAKASYSALDKPGNPKAAKQLAKAKAKASKLGLSAGKKKGGVAGPSRIPSVVYIGHQAEKKFGLSVGENPAFGGVEPVHVPDSYHYRTDSKGRGEAIDVSGDATKMMAFDHWVAKKWGKGVTELFYDPGVSIKEGTPIGAIGGHEDHVHVAVAMPGEKIGGGVAVGSGGAMFIGYGSSASAAVASANNARSAAAKGKGKHQSPYASAWKKLHKLDELEVGTGRPTTTETKTASAPSTSELQRLEAKYGAAA